MFYSPRVLPWIGSLQQNILTSGVPLGGLIMQQFSCRAWLGKLCFHLTPLFRVINFDSSLIYCSPPFISSILLAIIVEKSKKCLDFSVTLFLIHIVTCSIYGGFPSTWDWWIIHTMGMILMVVLGEYLCSKKELSDIPLLQLWRGAWTADLCTQSNHVSIERGKMIRMYHLLLTFICLSKNLSN